MAGALVRVKPFCSELQSPTLERHTNSQAGSGFTSRRQPLPCGGRERIARTPAFSEGGQRFGGRPPPLAPNETTGSPRSRSDKYLSSAGRSWSRYTPVACSALRLAVALAGGGARVSRWAERFGLLRPPRSVGLTGPSRLTHQRGLLRSQPARAGASPRVRAWSPPLVAAGARPPGSSDAASACIRAMSRVRAAASYSCPAASVDASVDGRQDAGCG